MLLLNIVTSLDNAYSIVGVKQAIAKQNIVIADSSKFSNISGVCSLEWNTIDTIITDKAPTDKSLLNQIASRIELL